MSTGLYTHRTRNAGEIVTDVLYNTAHKNQQQNDIPNMAGGLSDDLTAFQATQDPAPGGVANVVASVLEEFQQLRFALADIKTALNFGVALAQWYIPVDVSPAIRPGKGARVYRSSPQALSYKTSTAFVLDTERYDTGATDPLVDPFWVVGQPTRLTATVAGLYQLNGFVTFTPGTGGAIALFIRYNGSTLLCSSEWVSNAVQTPTLAVSTQYLMALNDYVELVAFQVSGNPTLSAVTPEFGLELLNPSAVIAPPTQWTLTITESGTGTGAVTSSPGSINCPGICSGTFADATMVTLTATPATGGFVQWSGDIPVPDQFSNPVIVTMDQARTIDALFTAYTLNITEDGTGSGTVTSDIGGINCPGTCAATYAPGDVVQLTAVATAGAFTAWSGDLVSTTNPDSITMDADKTVTATFELTGVIFSFANGGSTNLLNTVYIAPASIMAVNATAAAVTFVFSIDVILTGIGATMVSALAAAHTVTFQYTIGGVDDGSILLSLATGNIDGVGTGVISVTAGTTITIKAVQSGGGGDNIQSLTVVYQPQ